VLNYGQFFKGGIMPNSMWTPNGLYVLKSGPNAGKSLEYLLLHDPAKVVLMRQALEKNISSTSNLNEYHNHLLWLVEQLEKLSHNLSCDCGQPAEVILALGDSHQGYTPLPYPFCNKCAENEIAKHRQLGTIVPLSPWGVRYFKCKKDAKRVWQVICDLLNIRKLRDQALFERLKTVN